MPRTLNYRTLQDLPRELYGRNEISADVLLLDEVDALKAQFRSVASIAQPQDLLPLRHAFRWLNRNIDRGSFLWIDPQPPLTRHVHLYIERSNDAELFALKAGHLFTRQPGAAFADISRLKARAACVHLTDPKLMQRWLGGNATHDPAPFPREREIKRYKF